ncbi:MAG: apolipoprotein N-acyltransferase [Actinomycetota bacterium]|jgi:apolipoprotein N-acyltransferase
MTPSSNRARYFAALGSGALVAFSLPPWGWWPLAFIGIAIFARITTSGITRKRTQFLLGTIFAFGWFAPGMCWMWFLTPPGYVIAVILFAAFHGVASVVGSRSMYPLIALPLAHALAETFRFSFPFGGVPLASLAISQSASPLVGIVRIGGPLLLTFCVLQIGFALSQLVVAPKVKHLAMFGAIVALVVCAGIVAPNGSDTGETRTIAAVQGGGPQGTLAINTNPRDVVERHLAATRAITSTNLDMVIWPENVIDVADFYDSVERTEIAEQAARLKAPFVVGITEDMNARYFTNAQIVVNEDGTLGDRYDKVRRVPFGEFVPLRGLLETLGAPVDRIPRDALAGSDIAQLQVDDTTVGVVISWEVFFSGRANEGVEAGGSVLVNPTNGSSYTGTILQTQQIASSRLRAIENGRWLVQVSPTGFSAFISPTGEVFDRTGVSEQRVLERTIGLRSGRTLYSNLGDLPFIVLMVAVLGSLVFIARKRRLSALS